jgi:hypothetical protein
VHGFHFVGLRRVVRTIYAEGLDISGEHTDTMCPMRGSSCDQSALDYQSSWHPAISGEDVARGPGRLRSVST